MKKLTLSENAVKGLGIVGLGLGLLGTVASSLASEKAMDSTIEKKVAEQLSKQQQK